MTITAEILELARKGDRKAQYTLYRQCFPVLMSVCRRYNFGEQDAVAVLNIAFLKIIQNLHRYSLEAPFEAWIRRIQINVVIDEFRKNKKWQQVTATDDWSRLPQTDLGGSQWNEGDLKLEAGYLERLVNRLPPVTRQVFNLFVIDGFSHNEIGTMLGISDGTSKWHVNAARNQLKTWLAELQTI